MKSSHRLWKHGKLRRFISYVCLVVMLAGSMQECMTTTVYAQAAPVTDSAESQSVVSQSTDGAEAGVSESAPAVSSEASGVQQTESSSTNSADDADTGKNGGTAENPADPGSSEASVASEASGGSSAAAGTTSEAVISEPAGTETSTEEQSAESGSSESESAEPVPAALSGEAQSFIDRANALTTDDVIGARKNQFEAAAALDRDPENEDLKQKLSDASDRMETIESELSGLEAAYSALSDQDKTDATVSEAEQHVQDVRSSLTGYDRQYFTDLVSKLEADVTAKRQAYNDAKAAYEKAIAAGQQDTAAGGNAADSESDAATDTTYTEDDLDALQKSVDDAADALNSLSTEITILNDIYNLLSDDAKADSSVAEAYGKIADLQALLVTAAPALRRAKKAPANNATTVITGKIDWNNDLARYVLMDAVNDQDFFQFKVTVKKQDGKEETYTTSLSSTDCHVSFDFDYNFTITGIQLEDTDTVTVECVPNTSISSFSFSSETATLTDGNWNAGTLKLSIPEINVTINDVVAGGTGNTLYNQGNWSMSDNNGHSYTSGQIAYWGNGEPHTITIPKGASFKISASRDGYILSTLSSNSVTRTNGNTSVGAVPETKLSSDTTYNFVWVKKATDEESTFTKTWLDDGTDTATHENTPNLVTLQYSTDNGTTWNDANNTALKVPEAFTQTFTANGNESVYTLNYAVLPEYLAVKNADGTYSNQKISYRIDEKTVPAGYSKKNDGQNLVNTKEYTLKTTIKWQDSNNAEGVRPTAEDIKYLLDIYNGETNTEVTDANIVVTDNGNGTYTVTVHGLPSYGDSMDSPNSYYFKAFTIDDKTASDGKKVSYSTQIANMSGIHENSTDAWNGATITCTISKKTDFTATKKWDDLFPSLRPSAQLGLYRYTGTNTQNMELVAVKATPNNGTKAETDPFSFNELDAYDSKGNQYNYVVKETIPASDNGNYQAIYQNASGKETTVGCPNGGTVLNKNVKNTTSISVRKHWIAKGTTLKVAGYTVHVGLRRYTTDADKAEIVNDSNGNPLVQSISGFADYNDLTSSTTFKDLPMTDSDGNFYTYVPYEVKEGTYITTADVTLDQNDSFTIKDSSGEFDTYKVTEVTSADCSRATTKTRVTTITNTLGGTIRFKLSKTWAAAPNTKSVKYAIHRVDPYGEEEVLDSEGNWVAKADASQTYTGELTGDANKTDWGSIEPEIVLPLYDENSSRYTYFVDEVGEKTARHYFDYTISQDDTQKADLVESVAINNDNGKGGGDGQMMDFDLYKTWVDGGDTSTRRPVVIKAFRKDKDGTIDRPAEWDNNNIGIYTLSADNGWHVTKRLGFSEAQLKEYFGAVNGGTRTLIENGVTRTFSNTLSEDIVYREVQVGDTKIDAGKNCSYDGYTTTLESGNGVTVTQNYKVSYAGDNGSEVRNIKQGKVVYEIDKKWYDGHYLKGRPAVTFNITQDDAAYASIKVSVGQDGKVTTSATIDGKEAKEGTDYTFTLGTDSSDLNDYTITFNNFPLYNEEAGTRYTYACTESMPGNSGYTQNSQLDSGFPRTTTGAAGENNENLKITTSFRNRRVDDSKTISYTKVWKDNNNSENIRPKVTLNLVARVKSANQLEAVGGDESKLPLIPISCDTYMESKDANTFIYTFAQQMPKYVTQDLVNASNGKLTADDIGAEVIYYASETMTGDGASEYTEKDTPAAGTAAVTFGNKTYLANGSTFTNTMTATMEAKGTKVFSNVPYDMESDPLVMPTTGSIIFKLTQNDQPYMVDGKQATAELQVSGNSFSFEFQDKSGKTLQLPKYDEDGKPYTYSITESFPEESATTFNKVFEMTHVSRDLQVTNKYIAAKRTITVTKTFDKIGWTQAEIDGGRYPDVQFTLYRVKPGQTFNKDDASQKLKTVTIEGSTFKEKNGTATVTFDNLYDVTPSGQRFAYYVVEKAINGYTTYSKAGNNNNWIKSDTVAMQSDDRKTIYNEAFFNNDYQEENFITLSATKSWFPEGITNSFDVKNSDLTFHVNGYVNFADSNVDNVDYTENKDFTIKWDSDEGSSNFTILDKDGKELKFRRYTSQGVAYVYRITEDTDTDIWKAGGKLENFNCSTGGHYVNKWTTDAGTNDTLNLGTLTNVYGRTSLRVTKQWDDNSNKNDMRPRSITVKLQYNSGDNNWKDVTSEFLHRSTYDVTTGDARGTITANTVDGVTYTLKSGVKDQNRTWTDCLIFNNLPLYANGTTGTVYSYRAVETAIGGDTVDNNVAASYTYDDDSSSNTYSNNITYSTLRNNLLPASVTVEKTWEDSDNKYLARPDSLTLYLQRKVEGGTWEYVKHSSDDTLYTVTITAADGWKYAEQDTLPREDVNGKKYIYRFTEKAEGATGTDDNLSGVTVAAKNGTISYTGSETTKQAGTYITDTKITNTLEKTSLTVTKKWASTDGQTPVTFQIQYKDDSNNWTAFKDVTVELNSGNNWTATINDLPKRGKDGSTRYYRAVELDKNNSTVNFTDNGTTVTSKDGARDFELATGMFRAVYSLAIGDNGTSETVTNIKRTTVNVTKTFQDGANREVYRPSSLLISCVSNNTDADSHTRTDNATKYTSSKKISSTTDKYKYSFVVDQYDSNGKKLTYEVTETFENNSADQKRYTAIGSLSTSREGAATVILEPKLDSPLASTDADTVAITNIHGISVFNLTLNKTWTDSENFYQERPSSITVTLQYSTDGTHWNAVKKGQLSDDPNRIPYSEDVTAGYSTDDATKTLTVNKDGSINAEDATWHNLPVYARVNETRKQIQYRVLENQVKDYNDDKVKASTSATGDPTNFGQSVKVTLDNVLNTTSVTVTKKWADDNNFNGQRQNIDVQLYQNGTALKNGQLKNKDALIKLTTDGTWTYTFRDLPKQDQDGKAYTYTVDEVNVPNGYAKSVNGTTITNTLNLVTAAICVTKDFGTNDWTTKAPKGFTFTLTRGDNNTKKVTTPMPAGTSGNTATVTITKDTPDLTAAFADISYDHIGEYHYTLTENNGGVDGVAYDWDNSTSTQRTHNVVVTVTRNADNTLETSVKYDGKDSLTISNDFKTVETSIQVTKQFADWTKTSKGFTFKLTPQGIVPMPAGAEDGAVTKTATANAKTVDFGSISYEKTGTYTYTVQEIAGDEDGITYDTTPHKVEVVVTKDTNASNKLTAAVKYYDKDGKELKDGLSVTNTFTPTSGELKVKKNFNDWSKAGSFTFDLTPVSGAPMPAGTADSKKAVTVTDGNAVSFGGITYDKAGTYTYHIREEKGTASGVQYDTAEHTAVVTVEKDTNNNNKLSVTGITYDGKQADALVVTNTFASVQANLEVTKNFNGWTDEAYGNYFDNTKFTFKISAVTAGAPLPTVDGKNVTTATATKADPVAKFAAISFDKEGTYTYNITETNDHKDGISYDGNTHTATVTVTKDQDNKLSVTSIKYDKAENNEGADALTITNTYSPVMTAAPIQVTKSFSDWTRTEKGFTFTLTAGSNIAGNGEDGQAVTTPMPTGATGTSMTAKSESSEKATAVFGNITYRKAGTYNYTITEENGEEDGISYDAATHNVKVEVSKNQDTNALTAAVTYDGQSSLTITNTVSSETAHIQAKKEFNDWNNSANEFTFTLKAEGNAPMPEDAKNGAITGKATSTTPNVDFGAITYKKSGTYKYTITETNDGRDGVSYDTTKHTVTVTVTKAADRTNKLTASIKYDGDQDSLTIKNTFSATKATIGLTKSFTNPETKENWPADTSFTFDLTADSNTAGVAKNPMPDTTAVTATKDQPSVSFGYITFSKAGTYYYTVTERNSQVDGVSYDTKPHMVAVVVTKGAGNALSAQAYYDVTKNDKGTVPADAATSLTISNTFKPLKQTLKVTQSFNGWKDWNIFDKDIFTFTLTPVTANAPMPAGDNGSTATASKTNPEAVFGDITYTKAGTYEYTITETNNGVDGVAYDTNAHNVIVSVSKSDDASNTLSAVVKYDGKDSLTITNIFTPVFQNLSVSKNFNDWTKAKSFQFDLAAKDNAPMPAADTSVVIKEGSKKDANNNPSAAFGQIEFDKAGTYTYTITEENGGADGVDYTEGSKDKKPAALEVKVVIEKDKDTNALSVKSVDSLTVTNTYTPVKAHVEVTKDFNDWTKAHSFTFDLAADGNTAKDIDGNKVTNPMPKDTDGKEVTSKTVSEDDPKAVFDDMTFEYAGVYTYTLTERNDGRVGVSYDVNSHKVTVAVTKADDATNALTAKVTYEAADDNDSVPEDKSSLTIRNIYTPVKTTTDLTDTSIALTKAFNGWDDSQFGSMFDDAMFTMDLKAGDNTAKDVDGNPVVTPMPEGAKDGVSTITLDKDNRTNAFDAITYEYAGEYTYTIQEENGKLDGVSYDVAEGKTEPTSHTVTVTVGKADDATNALSIVSIKYDGNEDSLTITNVFTPYDPPVSVTKSINDWDGQTFYFTIKASDKNPEAPMPVNTTASATSDNPEAIFRNITFDKLKYGDDIQPNPDGSYTYEYDIQEVKGDVDRITYDTSVHKAYIRVWKSNDAANRLDGEVLYDDNLKSLTIVNHCDPAQGGAWTPVTASPKETQLTLQLTKDYDHWQDSDAFVFDLRGVNGAPMPDVLEATATKDKTTVGFGPITFTKPGTYQYGIKERDTGNQNINYDLSTHLVEVTIDKSADGKSLVVRSVKYDGGDSLTIRNTYKNAISRVITGVRTGDDSQMIIWFVLMIAAASAVIISIYIRKKRNS